MRVTAIVLAAGRSRRMGRPKQALPYGATTLIGAVVDALRRSPVTDIVVVVGPDRDIVEPCLAGVPVRFVDNPQPDDGMLSSVQRAIAAAGDCDAWLIALGDQPQLSPATVDALVATAGCGRGLIVPTWCGRRGHPVLIAARYREPIRGLPLTAGLNSLLQAHADDVLEVPVEDPNILRDIDTPEDYRALQRERQGGPPEPA